jgi:hypothetical protein
MPRRHAVSATSRSSFPAIERSLMCNPDCFYRHDGLRPRRVKAVRPRPRDHEGRARAARDVRIHGWAASSVGTTQ